MTDETIATALTVMLPETLVMIGTSLLADGDADGVRRFQAVLAKVEKRLAFDGEVPLNVPPPFRAALAQCAATGSAALPLAEELARCVAAAATLYAADIAALVPAAQAFQIRLAMLYQRDPACAKPLARAYGEWFRTRIKSRTLPRTFVPAVSATLMALTHFTGGIPDSEWEPAPKISDNGSLPVIIYEGKVVEPDPALAGTGEPVSDEEIAALWNEVNTLHGEAGLRAAQRFAQALRTE